MYVRPPKSNTSQRISVPENYGGNTFSPGGLYNDMPPPTRSIPPQADKEQRAAISDYPYGDSSQSHIAPPYFHPQNAREDNITYEDITKADPQDEQKAESAPERESRDGSIFSSLLPFASSSSNFPFGHGIGGEELLILGVMLLVYLSGNERGKVDNEFLLLLGLLLFSG